MVVIAVLAAAVLAGAASGASGSATLPPIRHVWIIVLENENGATSFGASSPAPYLARTLPAMGQYLPNYYGIGHASNDNYIAMISGEGPNPQNQADCQIFDDFEPGLEGPNGQAIGSGCVYPSWVLTVANQLNGAGYTWKAYEEDMGDTPSRESMTCGHPKVGSVDGTQEATASDMYATRHDPFVYFDSIIDSPICNQDVVNFDQLAGDLKSVATTPNYSFITPNLCDDGHDSPCANGQPGGLTSANAFLARTVPEILASPAFQENGLLIVTFDESGNDDSSCCGEAADTQAANGSNTPNASGDDGVGNGGGVIGAVLVSPYIEAGSVNQTAYNHYSMLGSIENLFGLQRLGFAGVAGLPTFGADVFGRTTPAPPTGSLSAAPTGSTGAAGSAGRCTGKAPLGHGALAKGTLIGDALLVSYGKRPALLLGLEAAAKVAITVRVHGRSEKLRSFAGRSCKAYSIWLPRGSARVTVVASIAGAHETRSLG